MYRLYELYNYNWFEKVNKETLQEISKVLHDRINKSECTHFRIDNDEVPLMIVKNNDYQYEFYKKNIKKIDKRIMGRYNHDKNN